MDRDGNFSGAFRAILKDADVEPVRLPAKSPDLNAQIGRFHLSQKQECLDRLIFFGERSLRNAVAQFISHYHAERNHQGLHNELIEPGDEVWNTDGDIQCRQRLRGLLKYYHRSAA
jgi:transposase InsO family protein